MSYILGPPEKPINVAVLAKFHNSITVGWEAGLNGGSEQHFKIFYREKGQKSYQESQDITGLKSGQCVNYTINGLQPKKEYEIKIVSINKFRGQSQSEAAMLVVATEGKTIYDVLI